MKPAKLLAKALALLLALFPIASVAAENDAHPTLDWIQPGSNQTHFVLAESGHRIAMWGVNYDHDGEGRLLEDYWENHWNTIVDDFPPLIAALEGILGEG